MLSKFLASVLALLMGICGIFFLFGGAMSSEPWYQWASVAFGQLFAAWGFGAYALGYRGPYNWLSRNHGGGA